MNIRAASLMAGAMVAALLVNSPPAPAQVAQSGPQRQAQQQEGLCRRAPAPIALPPEREARNERSSEAIVTHLERPRPPELRAPSPPPAVLAVEPPPASAPVEASRRPPPPAGGASSDEEESVVVTGTRVRRADYAASSPVTEARGPSAYAYRGDADRRPEPGLLTAGDYDDLLNPHLYARYVEGFLENESLPDVPRVDTRRVLELSVRDPQGRDVPFAAVTLTCADGNQLTLATMADGTAVFFPELDRLGSSVTVSVEHEGRATRLGSLILTRNARAQRRTITLDTPAENVRRLDLALVIDTTGSMADELEYLKTDLDAIVGDLNQRHQNVDIRVALVAYRDHGDEYVTRTFDFTTDVGDLRMDLSRQRADGGGDYPEAVEDALARAVALNWREEAVRSLLFVADAPPHADDVGAAWRSVEAARARRIQIVPVGASGVGPGAEYFMRAAAVLTQSRYIFLTDDSGIGNPHAEPSVDCYLVTSLGASIRRVLDSQISGRRIEPRERDIIRAVGEYDHGRCRRPQVLRR